MKSNWRERYHKNFYGIGKDREIYSQDGSGISDLTTIEKFIEQELLTQRKSIGEAVEKAFDGAEVRGNKIYGRCPSCKDKIELRDTDIKVKDTFIYKDVLSIIEETK